MLGDEVGFVAKGTSYVCVMRSLRNLEKWSKIIKFAFYAEPLGQAVSLTETEGKRAWSMEGEEMMGFRFVQFRLPKGHLTKGKVDVYIGLEQN